MSTGARVGVPRTAREASSCKDSFRRQRGNPLLNRLYSARSQVVHHAVQSALAALGRNHSLSSASASASASACASASSSASASASSSNAEPFLQLVLIGAGLDTSYDHHSDAEAQSAAEGEKKEEKDTSSSASGNAPKSRVQVFAVDFPEVLQERSLRTPGQEQRQHAGDSSTSTSTTSSSSDKNKNKIGNKHKPIDIPADLRQTAAVIELLLARGLLPSAPTLFLSEMVLNYLPTGDVAALVRSLTRELLQEQVPSLWISYDVHSLYTATTTASATATATATAAAASATSGGGSLVAPTSASGPSAFMQYLQQGFAARDAPLLLLPGGSNVLQCSAVGGYNGGNALMQHFTACWPCAFVRPMHAWLQVSANANANTDAAGADAGAQEQANTTTDTDTFDEFASLGLLHKHFAVGIYGNSPAVFADALQCAGVAIRTRTTRLSTDSDKAKEAAAWLAAAAVYKEALTPLANKHPAVCKFVKAAVRRISCVGDTLAPSVQVQVQPKASKSSARSSKHFWAFFVATATTATTTTTAAAAATSESGANDEQIQIQPLLLPSSGIVASSESLNLNMQQQQQRVVVGTIALRQSGQKGTLELSHMSVDEQYRRRGIGQLLLGEAVRLARNTASNTASSSEENAVVPAAASDESSTNNTTLELSVMTELEAASCLYLQAGFTPVGPPAPCGTCQLQRMVMHL